MVGHHYLTSESRLSLGREVVTILETKYGFNGTCFMYF